MMEIDFSPKSYKKFVTVSASFHNPRSVMRKAKEMGAVARLDSETCYSIRFDEPSPSLTAGFYTREALIASAKENRPQSYVGKTVLVQYRFTQEWCYTFSGKVIRQEIRQEKRYLILEDVTNPNGTKARESKVTLEIVPETSITILPD